MKTIFIIILISFIAFQAHAQNYGYQGQLTANPYAPNANKNPPVGNQFANDSNSPKLYDNQGNFHGNLNNNKFDPNSVSNPYGRYGNKFSPDSINNPYGAGNKFNNQAPSNKYGQGLAIYGQ